MAIIMSKKSFVEENISMRAQSPLHLTEGQKACLRLVVQHFYRADMTALHCPWALRSTDMDRQGL